MKKEKADVQVEEVMTQDVVTVTPAQKLIDVKHIFEKQRFHHHIPVAEGRRLRGMISLIDFLYAIKEASLNDEDGVYHKLSVKDIMREHPVVVSPGATLREAGRTMSDRQVHALVVTDKDEIRGIISAYDILNFLLSSPG